MAKTRAHQNRAIRQEALREQLANQKHIEKVVDNIGEIEGLEFYVKGPDDELDYKAIQATKHRLDALKIANDQRLKLINKYLPDLKQTELTGKDGGAIELADMTHEALDRKLQQLLDAVENPE